MRRRNPIWTSLAEGLAETHAREWSTAEATFLDTCRDQEVIFDTGTCVDMARQAKRNNDSSTVPLDTLIDLFSSIRRILFHATTELRENQGIGLKGIPVAHHYALDRLLFDENKQRVSLQAANPHHRSDERIPAVKDHLDIAAQILVNLLAAASQHADRGKHSSYFLEPYLRVLNELTGIGTLEPAYWSKVQKRFWLFACLEQGRRCCSALTHANPSVWSHGVLLAQLVSQAHIDVRQAQAFAAFSLSQTGENSCG